ncbi:MAG TPA: TraR/DksA C4-type zinc finger protein [candidate division Zixibacteria bacterium]|nr:TraR/DksA C4-type zinc finger protein [candidate division Zixibacteria bacterium]
MRKRELERLEKALLKKREELIDEIDLLRKGNLDTNYKEATGLVSGHTDHMADLGTDMQEREKAYYLADHQGRFLYHIDEALRRIKGGDYGVCQTCGKNIAFERLVAVPHARFCISCKSAEEARKQGL